MLLTDRSRYEAGLVKCPRARFLEYHYEGTGIRRKSQELPLATGIAVHAPLADLLTLVVAGNQQIPSRDSVRVLVQARLREYAEACKQGIQDVTSDQVAYVIAEQSSLIEGFVWSFYRTMLPSLLQEWEIVEVEREDNYVIA